MAVGMSQERLEFLASARASELTPGLLIVLPQHADEHRPQRPIFLAVEQQLDATPLARRAARAPTRER